MAKSPLNRILSRIYGHGRGWVFSKYDFIKEFSGDNIDKALSILAKDGKIRRITRGLYDYPKFSELLQKELSPDIEQVAYAYARKFNWNIVPSGDTALNILGISTQVPGRYIFLSNGPNRKYNILGNTLEFKHTALKNIDFKYNESKLIVQALKSLGKHHISDEAIEKFKQYFKSKNCTKILKDTQYTTVWIYEIIKKICKGK